MPPATATMVQGAASAGPYAVPSNGVGNSPSTVPNGSHHSHFSQKPLHNDVQTSKPYSSPRSGPLKLETPHSMAMLTSRASPAPVPVSVQQPSTVKRTHRIRIKQHPGSGRKLINQYEVFRELGRGQYGKVRLCRNVETQQYLAIKTVDRTDRPRLGRPRGSSAEVKIRRETAIFERCNHPNIVRLYEVLDDVSCRKIYLVLEYMERGEIKWQLPDGSPALSREAARKAAQDAARGISYLHSQGIVHRDIKPANLLVSSTNDVKITDFGVSILTSESADLQAELAKTVGTPAFFAPELCLFDDNNTGCKPKASRMIDVWAFGVTVYCFLYGKLPYEGDNEYELFHIIASQPLDLNDDPADQDLCLANDLLRHVLNKDPEQRWDWPQISQHKWMRPTNVVAPANIALGNQEDTTTRTLSEKIKSGLFKLKRQLRSGSSLALEEKPVPAVSLVQPAKPIETSTGEINSDSRRTSAGSEIASDAELAVEYMHRRRLESDSSSLSVNLPATAPVSAMQTRYSSPLPAPLRSVRQQASHDYQQHYSQSPTANPPLSYGSSMLSNSYSGSVKGLKDRPWNDSLNSLEFTRAEQFVSAGSDFVVDLIGRSGSSSSESEDDEETDDSDSGHLTLNLGGRFR